MRNFLSLLVLCTLPGCAVLAFASQFDCANEYVDPVRANIHYTNYIMGSFIKTPKGIKVDTSGQTVDLNRIDQLTDSVEACLQAQGAIKSINRCGIRVKIAPDWSTCPGGQSFPCKDPNFTPGCEKIACSCGCYGVVEYPSTMVVPPGLAAYPHELVHDVTKTTHTDGETDLGKMAPVFRCGLTL